MVQETEQLCDEHLCPCSHKSTSSGKDEVVFCNLPSIHNYKICAESSNLGWSLRILCKHLQARENVRSVSCLIRRKNDASPPLSPPGSASRPEGGSSPPLLRVPGGALVTRSHYR